MADPIGDALARNGAGNLKIQGGGSDPLGAALSAGEPRKKKTKHGFLGTVGHVFSQGAADLKDAALNAPGGVYELGKGLVLDEADLLRGRNAHRTTDTLLASGKQTVEDLRHPLRHPGLTALDALGVASVGAGTGARIAAAGKAVGEAGEIGKAAAAGKAVKALATKPKPGKRVLKVGGLEARGHYSRSALARGVQKTVDAGLQRAEGATTRPGQFVESRLHARAAKFQERAERVADAKARASGTRLAAAARKLTPAEQRALRIVAEEVPVGRRLGAQEMRAARAKNGREARRHQERIQLTRDAMEFLDEGPDGKPVFKPSATKLRKVYGLLERAAGERSTVLKQLDLLDEQAQQAAKTDAARIAAGARMETQKEATAARGVRPKRARVEQIREYPARSKTHTRPRTVEEAQARLKDINRRYDELIAKVAPAFEPPNPAAEQLRRNARNARIRQSQSGKTRTGAARGGVSPVRGQKIQRTVNEEARRAAERKIDELIRKNPEHPVAKRVAGLLDEAAQLRQALEHANAPEFMRDPGAAAPNLGTVTETIPGKPRRVHLREQAAAKGVKAKPQLVGAEDIAVSPGAPFIGNPVERTKFLGRPKVSSTGTFGHTTKPGSLKRATGGSVEHGLERNDTTNIVAERHREATRLANIRRRSQQLAKAGAKAPRRKDDVFVWTDSKAFQERIPPEVRRFLDNPDGLAKLPRDEQTGVIQTLKDAMLSREDWRDPQQLDEFETLAKEGKGVFVPRKLMGSLAKDDYAVSGIPGMKFADAVSNAQKLGLIYLKLNYPVVQGASNLAMNLIQQGPFAIPNLTRAVRLDHTIGPETAAVLDDIMGQGAVMQAAFEGQGPISRVTQKVAHVMTSKVDTPARRAAFLHEAIRAGYNTPAKLRSLIDNDANAGDLAEVAQRAKEAIVDYGELSPFERQIVRRLVFVYPWQKGATKYAGHFLRDHPVQAAALGVAGEQGKQKSEQAFGPLPSYLEGLIPVDGRAVNPSGVNFFQTPAQIGEAVAGLASGNPAAPTGQQFLSPAPALGLALATGRDDLGFPLQGNLAKRLRQSLVEPTPLAAAFRTAVGGREGAGPDLVRDVFGSRTASKSFPDSSDALYRFLLGGLYPRRFNRDALNQNAAREKTGR